MDAASVFLLVFSGGTVLSAVLQRLLLEKVQTSQHLVELNVGEMFALAAIVSLVFENAGSPPSLGKADLVILLVGSLAWFVPEQHGIYLGLTVAGGWFLLKRRSDPRLVGIAQIWLALSFYELWGKLIFKCVYQTIEVVEVRLIYQVGRLFYSQLGVNGASLSVRGDWSILILEGCSSFHNLSLAALIWLSILKLADYPATPRAIRALAVSAALVVAINVGRILAMLPSSGAFHFWHEGTGSTVVALASVLAAVIPVVLLFERQKCRVSQHT